jgi:Phytanoyl-CoA dioxygenase (PhyH)
MQTGLGVPHLRQMWSRTLARRGSGGPNDPVQWAADRAVMDGLGLGLQETLQFLFARTPDFDAFERWILERNGGAISTERIALVNRSVDRALGHCNASERDANSPIEDALTPEDLAFWDEHGYVVLHDAASRDACRAAERVIWDFIGMDPDDPDSWYGGAFEQGIMVPLVHHPALDANRRAQRIHCAFAQLWGSDDLAMTIDRCGFNPPEREGWRFHASGLHWDTSLARPIPLATQGVLYLTDTPAEQGAFRCVPGFHRRIDGWLDSLPVGANPRKQDLDALEPVSVGGRAGDFIIWNGKLPHGASPNRGTRPRIVQYIAMYPPGRVDTREWV